MSWFCIIFVKSYCWSGRRQQHNGKHKVFRHFNIKASLNISAANHVLSSMLCVHMGMFSRQTFSTSYSLCMQSCTKCTRWCGIAYPIGEVKCLQYAICAAKWLLANWCASHHVHIHTNRIIFLFFPSHANRFSQSRKFKSFRFIQDKWNICTHNSSAVFISCSIRCCAMKMNITFRRINDVTNCQR